VLTLRKIYALSQKEIAAQLGISEHTVEVQVANGMRRCAAFLAKHGLP
jgi:RNA polymerase sigma-70 factor (ECF subfamily)